MPKLTLESLGRHLADRRGGMGIRAVAQEIGVSPATLSRVERGFLPDLDTFAKICRWMNIDAGQVLGTSTPSTGPKIAVHFKKNAALPSGTAQALAKMVVAAHRAWLASDPEKS